MKRSYAYLLATAAIVAAISGVAIAQQKTAAPVAAVVEAAKTALAPKADDKAAAPVVAAATTPAAPAFDLASVQSMPVGLERGQKIAANVCASCHGADGNSAVPLQPILAGQHEAYLLKQLNNFKIEKGATEPLRANMIDVATGQIKVSTMGGQAAPLSEGDMKSLAMWFSSQTVKPSHAQISESALSKLGERIYRGGVISKALPACAGCHGPTGAGIMAKYPRMSGQYAEYLAAQLKAFREDVPSDKTALDAVRNNAPAMRDIAKRMTDTEIAAVADYMAGLR